METVTSMLNLRGFYNQYCTLLSDDQRALFSYQEGTCPSLVLMQGVLVLTVQPADTGTDASFSALQVKEPKVYKYGAHLLECFADHFLPVNTTDGVRDSLSIALYGAGFQCVVPITNFKYEVQHAHGTLMRKDKEHEVSRVCGVILRRK